MPAITAAALQLDAQPGNLTANLDQARLWGRRAVDQGARLLLLPELYNTGYDLELISSLNYDFPQQQAAWAALAGELGVWLAVGLLEQDQAGYANSLCVFSPHGEDVARYRKNRLFSLSREREIFRPGREGVLCEIDGLRCGLLICFDIRFPELARSYRQQGCDALLVASAWPLPRLDHWRILLAARAVENQCYLLAANRVGRDASFWFLGNSCLLDPWGVRKDCLGESEAGMVLGVLDSEEVVAVRRRLPCLEEKDPPSGPEG